MKYDYIKRYLCISLTAITICGSFVSAAGEELSSDVSDEWVAAAQEGDELSGVPEQSNPTSLEEGFPPEQLPPENIPPADQTPGDVITPSEQIPTVTQVPSEPVSPEENKSPEQVPEEPAPEETSISDTTQEAVPYEETADTEPQADLLQEEGEAVAPDQPDLVSAEENRAETVPDTDVLVPDNSSDPTTVLITDPIDPLVLDPTSTPTPTPEISPENAPSELTDDEEVKKTVQSLIDRIEALKANELMSSLKEEVESIRSTYDSLSDEYKSLVTNYEDFVNIEKSVAELVKQDELKAGNDALTDGRGATKMGDALLGTPVYFTNMVSNLHAGKEFYLNSLENNYHLKFSEDFASVMEAIEKEYKDKNGLNRITAEKVKAGQSVQDSPVVVLSTGEPKNLLVRNWQDILAVYVYEQALKGETSYTLTGDSKDELARIFADLNPVIDGGKDTVSYGNRHISYYIKKNNLNRASVEFLNKYVETDCCLLCAVVTASDGFIRQSVGTNVSEDRINVIRAAYSLIGKVGYFWGGKSFEVGEDQLWGQAMEVTSEGSKSTGTVRAYGLDCSGFVTWAVINGYHDTAMANAIGNGTSEQWENANVVSESDAKPGDLVFQRGPEAGSDNHVGILCGKTDSGDWIAVHCSSSKNGVTVGEAYGASFRYIRQPSFYVDEISAGNPQQFAASTKATVTITDSMKDKVSASTGIMTTDEIPASSDKSRKAAVTASRQEDLSSSKEEVLRPSAGETLSSSQEDLVATVMIPREYLESRALRPTLSSSESGYTMDYSAYSGDALSSDPAEIITVVLPVDDALVGSF